MRQTRFDAWELLPTRPSVPEELRQGYLAEISRTRGDLTGFLYTASLEIAIAADPDMRATTERIYNNLLSFQTSDTKETAFPACSAQEFSFTHEFYGRPKLAQMMLRLEQDPNAVSDWASGQLQPQNSELVFSSNQALLTSHGLGHAHFGALLGCMSPYVWAIHGQRVLGAIIFPLGRLLSGSEGRPSKVLDLLPHDLSSKGPSLNPGTISAASFPDAVEWWGSRLQKLYEIILDPTHFGNSKGDYLPYMHQNWIMNFEHAFQRVAAVQRSALDSYAQQTLIFTALDLFADSILGISINDMCNPVKARKVYDQVSGSMPQKAQEVLLPMARLGLESLDFIADGFFIQKTRNTSTIDIIGDSQTQQLTPNRATQKLIQARRNATHGFGNEDADKFRQRLLAHHDGRFPLGLSGLPYLYLLSVLADPGPLSQRIRRIAQS